MRTAFLIGAMLAAPLARAAQAVALSVEELARTSDLVVRGRVARVESRWSEDGWRIFTFADVEAAESWRGRPAGSIRVLVPGGVIGRIGQRVDGAPILARGEEVVLFLIRGEASFFRVTGLAQGKFSVDGATARPDLTHVSFVGSRVGSGERRAEAMPLAELERRAAAARTRALP
jgi:hypothetical protein